MASAKKKPAAKPAPKTAAPAAKAAHKSPAKAAPKPAAKAPGKPAVKATVKPADTVTHTDQAQLVPLSSLTAARDNVRRELNKTIIAELEHSILSLGILNALTVTSSGAKFTVITGNHRLTALQNLAAAGKIAADYPVPCVVKSAGIDATEAGLAENIIRADMDPLDQCTAFQRILQQNKGMTLADVAGRFGVTETVVKKRLTLAGMPAKISKAYRDGRINLEQLQAFAATDDNKLRESVFNMIDKDGKGNWDWKDGDDIRRMLVKDEVTADTKFARFVGLQAYQDAGGDIRKDLFNDDPSGTVILDAALLTRLANEKLAAKVEELKAQGWAWVKGKTDYISYTDTSAFERLHPKREKLSPADEKTLKDLKAKVKVLEDIDDDMDEPSLTDAQEAERDRLNEEIEAVEARRERWTDNAKSQSGVMVGLSNNGSFEIEYGLMDKKLAKQKEKEKAKSKAAKSGAVSGEPEETEDDNIPKPVLRELAIHRSSAIAAGLAATPFLALAVTVYTWALDVLYEEGDMDDDAVVSCWHARLNNAYDEFGDSKTPYSGVNELLRMRNNWLDITPEKESQLWDWVLAQTTETLLQLQAWLVAQAFNDISVFGGAKPFAVKVAQELRLDMTKHYTPQLDDFFSRLDKPQLFSIIKEGRGEPATPAETKLKKSQLAELAEKAVAGKGWLPAQLRIKPKESQQAAG